MFTRPKPTPKPRSNSLILSQPSQTSQPQPQPQLQLHQQTSHTRVQLNTKLMNRSRSSDEIHYFNKPNRKQKHYRSNSAQSDYQALNHKRSSINSTEPNHPLKLTNPSPNLTRQPSIQANQTSDVLPQLDLSTTDRTIRDNTPGSTEPKSRPSSRRFSHSTLEHPPWKLNNRASSPLFSLGQPIEQDEPSITRPTSVLSRPSTPRLFQRIKAGLNPKPSFASSSPSPSNSNEFLPDPTPATNNKPTRGPPRSSSELQLAYFDLSQDHSIFPLYRSQSDSLGQPRQTIEELRPSPLSPFTSTPTPTQPSISRSFSQARLGSPITPRPSELFNRSLGPSTPSREYSREGFLDSRLAPGTSSSTTQQPPGLSTKLRRPRTSTSHQFQPLIELAKKTHKKDKEPIKPTGKLKPLERSPADESEESYLIRLGTQIEKSKIPSVLASSNDPFHLSALTKFMHSFEFSHDPIDLSIRKLLMVVDLPTETQQIDRLIESFSKRYVDCNPKLFNSPDQVYILAFSIIMLHTDAFNKSNKAKMSRADYVKNTKMDGIPNELLEYIYDNITYTPFVYVDPDRDISRLKMSNQHQQPNDVIGTTLFNLGGTVNNMTPILQSSSILPGGKDSRSKLDPYQLIAKGSTHELRPDLGSVIPSRNPFSFTGSVSWFDFKRLRESFNPAKSVTIQIVNLTSSKTHSIFKQIEAEDPAQPDSPMLKRTAEDGIESKTHNLTSPASSSYPGFLNLRAIKVGLVHLKIDSFTTFTTSHPPLPPSSSFSQSPHIHSNSINEVSMSKNVITKKWKLFCVLLTARQLILIKDVGLAAELQESIKLAGFRNQANPEDQLVVRITGLKPDLVLSLDGGVAFMDADYQRRPCTFRLILTKDLSLLMGVDDNDDMNSWITHINYAAAYKTHRLPFWPSQTYQSSPRPSMTTPVAGNTHRVYQRAALDGADSNPRNEDSSESLLSSSSVRHRHHHQQQQKQQQQQHHHQENGRKSLDRTPISRAPSFSNSLSARPFDIGPNLIGESPRSSSVHSQRHSTVSSTNLLSHWDLVRAQIVSLEGQIMAAKTELNEDLRLARNLAVLTPFQLSSRSKLQLAIMPVANRVRNSRSHLSKLVCYREIFVRDLSLGSSSTEFTPSGQPGGLKTTNGTPSLSDTTSPSGSKNAPLEEIRIRNSVERRSSVAPVDRDPQINRTSLPQSASSPTPTVSGQVKSPQHQTDIPSEENKRIGDKRPIEIISRRVESNSPPSSSPRPPTTAATSHGLSVSISSTSTVVLPASAAKNLSQSQRIRSPDLHPTPSSSSTVTSNPTLVTSPVRNDHNDGDDNDATADDDHNDDNETDEEVLACLRKVGRHANGDLRQDTFDSRHSHHLDPNPYSTATSLNWSNNIARTRSGTSISGRSFRDNCGSSSAPMMSANASTRSIVKIPFLSSSTSNHNHPAKKPSGSTSLSAASPAPSIKRTSRSSIVTSSLFDPPPPIPSGGSSLKSPEFLQTPHNHHHHRLFLSRPSTASSTSVISSVTTTASTIKPLPKKPTLLNLKSPPPSSSSFSASSAAKTSDRAAAKARMLDKARLIPSCSSRPVAPSTPVTSPTFRSGPTNSTLSPPFSPPPSTTTALPPTKIPTITTSPTLLTPIVSHHSASSSSTSSRASSFSSASILPHRSIRTDKSAHSAAHSSTRSIVLGGATSTTTTTTSSKRFTQAWGLP